MVSISCIMPIYNVEQYLKESLESVLCQSFQDYEIICINDGSTDNSLNVLKKYAEQDSRIKILNQDNKGQGAARNLGINNAIGEIIIFLDPDDILEENAFDTIYKSFQKTKANIIQFDYKEFYDYSNKIKNRSLKQSVKKVYKFNLKSLQEYVPQKFSLLRFIRMCCWDKAYKRDFIEKNDIRFALSKHAEDHIFVQKALFFAKKIFYINKYLYKYRIRANSAVNKVSEENFCIFDNLELTKQFLIENHLYPQKQQEYYDYALNLMYWHYNNIPENKKSEYVNKVQNTLSKSDYEKFNLLIQDKLRFSEKVFSIRNKKIMGKKEKYITILGLSFKLKSK